MRKTKIECNDELLTDRILQIIKNSNSIVIQNRLLNGEYHYQTVGKTSDNIVITCELKEDQKDRLEEAFANVESLTLTWLEKKYIGKMEQKPICDPVVSYVGNRIYSVNFTLICPRG